MFIRIKQKRSIFTLIIAILLLISGVTMAVSGRVLFAKLLFEQVDQCRLGPSDVTIRLYLGSFGATTAYTQLVTVQNGRLSNERIVFSSYGGIPIDSLVCDETTVSFVGEQNWSFSKWDLQTRLVESPIILEWGEPVSSEDSLSWDPFQLFCSGPLLILGVIIGFIGGKSLLRELKTSDSSA